MHCHLLTVRERARLRAVTCVCDLWLLLRFVEARGIVTINSLSLLAWLSWSLTTPILEQGALTGIRFSITGPDFTSFFQMNLCFFFFPHILLHLCFLSLLLYFFFFFFLSRNVLLSRLIVLGFDLVWFELACGIVGALL